MDLRSVYPFWLLDKGILHAYPSLDRDIRADITIMGAGISGALTAWYLRKSGKRVVMVDRRHAGMGSTAATTGLLQYEIDTPLIELAKQVGRQQAIDSYLRCGEAIDELAKICSRFPASGFKKRPSLQYASFKKDLPALQQEYAMRKAIGIPLRWMDQETMEKQFGFSRAGALFSAQGGEVNAYALVHGLLHSCTRANLEVYDHTEIRTIHRQKSGFELRTSDGIKISTRKLVIACGYESARYIPKKIEKLHSTYAIVSEPFDADRLWYRNALIWETADPYLYLRTTTDRRILVGGKDDDFSSGLLRDQALPRKVKALEKAFGELFPSIPFKTDFRWAGLFASTKDGLPYIGEIPGKKDIYFALGFGGNGIVFSVIAAQIIRDLIQGKKNREAGLFGFSR